MTTPKWLEGLSPEYVQLLSELREALKGRPATDEAKNILWAIWAAGLWELHELRGRPRPLRTMTYCHGLPETDGGWLALVLAHDRRAAPDRPTTLEEAVAQLAIERGRRQHLDDLRDDLARYKRHLDDLRDDLARLGVVPGRDVPDDDPELTPRRQLARLREAMLRAVQAAWKSGYLAHKEDASNGDDCDALPECADPGDYLDEALAELREAAQ